MAENPHYAFVLVSDEKYWNRLCSRNQTGKEIHAFVRKNQVAPKNATKLLFYVKKPLMQVRGTADFIERLVDDHKAQWIKYGSETCFENFDEYNTFIQGREKVTFVRFKNLLELQNPQPKEITRNVLGSQRWFRGRYLDQKTAEQLTI
jgi:predicted transcriptional regulator